MYSIQNNQMMIEGCSAVSLAETFGTPLYVYSERAIRKQIQSIKDQFTNVYDHTFAAYASKAFLTSALVKIIDQEGLHLDVVSGGELYIALNAGFPANRIIMHGNNKSDEELTIAVEKGVGRIVVDNIDELNRLSAICHAYNKVAPILFRITPGVKGITHDYISTGQKDSKFGISLDPLIILPIIKSAIDNPHIDLKGFHFHVGSQLFDHNAHIAATEVALSLIADIFKKEGYVINELNVGGGFGIHYTKGDAPKSIAYFMDAIMSTITKTCHAYGIEKPSVFIEPGRFIVGESGMTLYKVGSIKEIPDVRTYVALDGGMTDNIRPALYQAQYEAFAVSKMDKTADTCVTLCGKCCESGDILIPNIMMPSLKSGEFVAVTSTGAYTYAMASNYNKHGIPSVVLVNNDQAFEIVKRQSYKDLIERDRIPEHLK